MILVHGHYRLMRRLIAYRKDWCNACAAECHAEQFKTFRLGHLYWIPLLPLGFWRTWECSTCHKDPRARVKESLSTLIIALVLCSIFLLAVVFTVASGGAPPKDREGMLGGVAFLVAAEAFLIWAVYSRLHEKPVLRSITPYPTDTCYYCKGMLMQMPKGRCESCAIDLAEG